jgi:hypothetical protein
VNTTTCKHRWLCGIQRIARPPARCPCLDMRCHSLALWLRGWRRRRCHPRLGCPFKDDGLIALLIQRAARPRRHACCCLEAEADTHKCCVLAHHSGSHLLSVLAVASVALLPHHPCLPATPPPCRPALRPGIHSNGGLLLRPGASPPLLMSLRGGSEEKNEMGSADGADLDESEVALLLADAEHFCACTGAAQPNVVRLRIFNRCCSRMCVSVGIGSMHACATEYMQYCMEGPTPIHLYECLPDSCAPAAYACVRQIPQSARKMSL